MDTLYDIINQFLTQYIIPADLNIGGVDFLPAIFSLLVTVGLFWMCIARPIKWLFTYGLFGGSKKNPLTRKRRNDDD